MRIFALSDIHIDYDVNALWIRSLSEHDYRNDVLILAGDVTHKLSKLVWCLSALVTRFRKVLFVPGNHDLWVLGECPEKTSLQKFREVAAAVESSGASMQPHMMDSVLIAPVLGWYDYSFGEPSAELARVWMDYRACRWPTGFGPREAARAFADMNTDVPVNHDKKVITFSHFLPRIDLVPPFVPSRHRLIDPVLGSILIEQRLRRLKSSIHVYGHSHINRSVNIDGVRYVNNAFGYPQENAIASKRLLCVDEV